MRPPFPVLVVGLLAVACSGGDDDDDASNTSSGSRGPVSGEDFVTELVSAMCGGLGGCCQQAGLSYNRADCETILGAVYGSLLDDAAAAPDFDEKLAGECIADVRADSGSCDFSNFGGSSCTGRFSSALGMSRMAGEACGQSCERTPSGTSCWIDGNDPGECYREDDLYCSTATSSCAPLVKNGEQCENSRACKNGYCESAVCVPRLPEGGDCGFDDAACQDGLLCDFSSGQCQPKGDIGSDCVFDDDCASDFCDRDGTCAEDDGGADADMILAIACGG